MVPSLLHPYPVFFQPAKHKFIIQGNGKRALLPAECMGLHPREPMHKPATKDETVVRWQPASIGKQRWGKMIGF